MNCTDCREALHDFVDGELGASAASAVAAHVATCAACRIELASLRKLRAATVALKKEITPARDLWPEIAGETAAADPAPRPLWYFLAPLAVAAAMVFAAISAEHRARAPGWSVASVAGAPRIGATAIKNTGELRVGQWLETDAVSRARLAVGSIGEVSVEPNSRLRLVGAAAKNHRLELARGTMSALIWAPPRLFFVDTPSATAIDLGCAYTLMVAEDDSSVLRVTAGYVALDDHGRESIIPAHMECRTRPRLGPGTPFADDAPEKLRRALERFDFEHDAAALSDVLASARPTDAITLWHLLARTRGAPRAAVFDTLAAVSPPTRGITRAGILAGDATMRRTWGIELGLVALAFR